MGQDVNCVHRMFHQSGSLTRYLVHVGNFTSTTPGDSQDLCLLARSALIGRLSSENAVFIADPASSRTAVESFLRRHRMRGFFVEGRVRIVTAPTANRIEVSLIVQTNPAHEYRFESSSTVTLSGSDSEHRDGELRDAVRRAVQTAASRTVQQFGR
jgi:hypothetical protein